MGPIFACRINLSKDRQSYKSNQANPRTYIRSSLYSYVDLPDGRSSPLRRSALIDERRTFAKCAPDHTFCKCAPFNVVDNYGDLAPPHEVSSTSESIKLFLLRCCLCSRFIPFSSAPPPPSPLPPPFRSPLPRSLPLSLSLSPFFLLRDYVFLSIKGAAFNQGKTIGPKEGNPPVRGKAL